MSLPQIVQDFIKNYYLWIKAFHLIAAIAWMAGLFYLPRLFVYHSQSKPFSEVTKTFEIMEERLYRFIMQPSMYLSLALGFILAIIPSVQLSGWYYLKLIAVLGLVWIHLALNVWRKAFLLGVYPKSTTFFRFINEIPTVLLIIIVIAAIVKPF
ncbi:MAG: protoporphyrinogen oxidase HemJ [Proteobacteria bacterium]|nr:protoporphyrinogen oxidase HemJ [Pseudomonadota bacterium]